MTRKHLYIAFFCFDEPDKIRSTVAKRDKVSGEDYVGVFLDTFNDQRRAYILQFNPLGNSGGRNQNAETAVLISALIL